ncbi:MurR/RpiR family transcriptional regulator [Proteiniclasticum sp. BAD-10]|uniref:MurR/RpiR family transcriptional regulator n=1 Tax=Proteiniclasticum sediminis TaxID=2804028 RepID=A0A941CLZ4_9CLOT|nr:MurR/RpiR family transcriptional regulator [Proteiniclasticum sediminis]MBR0575062.1 MurR/RpiR family transcriptional regulator [Proteiniclasticum sediminis]
MSSVFRIKEGFSTYTETEKRLAEHILEHKDDVINFSAQVLGEKVNTSAAAVVRFAKKLGYKGWTALKVDLASDHTGEETGFDDIIKEEDTVKVLVRKAQTLNLRTLEQTYKLINEKTLQEFIDRLIAADTIYLFGVGGSGIVCEDFHNKLVRIGKRSVFNKDPHIQLEAAAHISDKDVALGISYSGNTKEVNVALEHASSKGALTLGITQLTKSKMNKICDLQLHVPSEEKELRLGAIQSRNSSLILTDLLYYGITKADIAGYKDKLKNTRSLIAELK